MAELTPVRLRDGTEAFVVPLLPANREALHDEYEHLSSETRFDRFLAPVPELTDKMLDRLVDDVDGIDHVALVLLVLTDDGTELPLGLARILRYPDDPTAADVAVTVVDEWHGRGVATALLEVLMRRRPSGLERVVTVVGAGNAASLAMLRRLGDAEVAQPESGTRRVVVRLPAVPDARRVRLPERLAGTPLLRARDGVPGGVVGAVPVEAQQGGVVLQGMSGGHQRTVGEGANDFPGVQVPGGPDGAGQIDRADVALEHPVGHEDQSITRDEVDPGAVVRRVGEHAQGQVDAQVEPRQLGVAQQVRRDVPSVDEVE